MNTTLRWGLAIVAVGTIGLGLLLVGVALGRATGGTAGYEPANATQNTYGPASTGSGSSAISAPPLTGSRRTGGAGVDGNSGPRMEGPGVIDGNYGPDTMGPGTTHAPARSAGVDGNYGPDTMGPGMMGGNSGRGMMGR